MDKLLKWSGVVALIAIALIFVPKFFNQPTLGGITNYDAVDVTDGYYVDGTQVINGSGSWIGTIVAAAKATFDGGVLHSYTNATSTTATAMTMVQADILNYETLLITPNTGALTYTLPATTTLTSLVPSAGDWQEQCWYNATGTSAATITIAAGTGIDLETASSTTAGPATSLVIGAGNSGCLKYIRKANTDILVQFTRFADGD